MTKGGKEEEEEEEERGERRRDKTTKGVSEDRDFCPIVDKRATAAGGGKLASLVSCQVKLRQF